MVVPPFVIGFLVLVAGLAGAISVLVTPSDIAADSAAAIAIGIVILTTIALSGLLVARGRWSRRLATGLVVAEIALVAVIGIGPWGWVALVAGLGALAGLLGRWLDGWVRMRPSATGPDPNAVVILLGLIALVPAVGIASPSGLAPVDGLLGAAGIALAWGYSKAHLWALWGIRLALPVIAVPAMLTSPLPGALLVGGLVGLIVGYAWTKPALIAVQPLMDRLPGPRIGTARNGEPDA